MVNKHVKRSSVSLVIRSVQIQTTMRYHIIPTRRLKLKDCQPQKLTGYEED